MEPLGRLGAAVLLLSCVVSVIGVFVRLGGSRSIERQQLKWFAYVTAVLVSVMLLSPAAASVIGAMGGSWEVMIATIATPILTALLGIPVVIGIAILRYRLYDIDVIINRSLVYGFLTAFLALAYFGGVTATHAVLQAFTGQEKLPQFVIVVSTLVIAALFAPLRRRIQSFIDRRFYRRSTTRERRSRPSTRGCARKRTLRLSIANS